MRQTPLVLIGIQARSTSTRLPNKVNMRLGDKTILRHVIDSCVSAAHFLNNNHKKYSALTPFETKVGVVCPKGDPITRLYNGTVAIHEGDNHDVLARYLGAARVEQASAVVRVTADCPFIPSHIISRAVKTAKIWEADYVSNVVFRTFPEGFDVEVISMRLLEWLNENAVLEEDREHVTICLSRHIKEGTFPFLTPDGKPNVAHTLNELDFSHVHTSVDTMADFERAEKMFESMRVKRHEARACGRI